MDDKDRVIGNTQHDDTIAKVIETARALVPEKRRKFTVWGFDVNLEINLNTLVMAATLIAFLCGGAYSVFRVAKQPFDTEAEVRQIRSEIGSPGKPGYVPGAIKGINRRIDALVTDMKTNHDDTLLAIEGLRADIMEGRKENNDHLNRIDDRMDRLVESQAQRNARRP